MSDNLLNCYLDFLANLLRSAQLVELPNKHLEIIAETLENTLSIFDGERIFSL